MSAARTFADELLARFTGPAHSCTAQATPAKAAKPAKADHPRGLQADSGACEGLRMSATPSEAGGPCGANSQVFAGVRNVPNRPESEQPCGLSQPSQVSQVSQARPMLCRADALAGVGWDDTDIARFHARRARLLRWGWPADQAEALADRLTCRDVAGGADRVSCSDCAHYRPGRCGNHRPAGLQAPELGRDLAGLLQRCPAFGEKTDT